MRKQILIPGLLLFIFIGLVFAPISQTQTGPSTKKTGTGTTPSTRFSGLDVTILVDQSGSMWKNPRNDRNNHRIGQTKNVIYRLAEQVERTTFAHRVSVINFGDTATVPLSNFTIRYNPRDPGGMLREAKAYIEDSVTAKDLMNTNTPDAMRCAVDEYKKMDISEHRPGNQRVMLIITDGRPDVPGESIGNLKTKIEEQARILGGQKVTIWVVGLNDASNYWNEGDGLFWEGVTGTGRARLAETAASKISTLVQNIVDEWLGAKSVPSINDEYFCPPYLNRVVFNVNMGLPRSPVKIIDPSGKEVTVSSGGSAVSPGTFTRFVVEDPKSGTYQIKRDPSRSYVTNIEEYSANIKRLSPIGSSSIEVPTKIVFQALTNLGTPLKQLTEWPITASIQITSPDGTTQEIKAEPKDQGKFIASWQPPKIGQYSIRLKGLITLKNGKSYDVFASNGASYDEKWEVTNQHAYFLRLNVPDPGRGVRVIWPTTSTELTFSLVDAKGEKVRDLSDVVKDPATWLKIQPIDISGVATSTAPTSLIPARNGDLKALIPANLDWTRGEGWWLPGRLCIQITPQPDHMAKDENYLDSIQLPDEFESLRIGSDPMMVGPLDVRFSWWVLAPILLFLLTFLLIGIWLIARYGVPQGYIWWVDTQKGRTIIIKIYDADLDPDGSYARKYTITEGYKFNWDRQVSVSVNGQDYIATKFRITRALSRNQVEVDLHYAWQHEPKKTYTIKLRLKRIERLKGLPDTANAITLEESS